ncbi:RNA methyltransferase [bacterium]|nr:RNA methyltransferase [bacterium]
MLELVQRKAHHLSNGQESRPLDSRIYTLVENVRSLYNVGAIFRTADGAGVTKILLTGITGKPPHREIRKVALGAEENVPWEYHAESIQTLANLKDVNFQIITLEATQESLPYDQVHYRFPLCLVLGHEYHGVSHEVIDISDLVIKIPMRGKKISLNVAVAYGIAIYEIAKSRPEIAATV